MPINLDDHLAVDGLGEQRLSHKRLNLIGEDAIHTMNAIERLSVAEKAMVSDDPAMDSAFRTAIHVPVPDKA